MRLKPLNFKVPADFHREFKTFAAMNGMSMLAVLTESFRLYREHKGEWCRPTSVEGDRRRRLEGSDDASSENAGAAGHGYQPPLASAFA